MFRLGYKLAFETRSKKKDWDDIFALWYSAATGGHKRAQFYLGTCYDHGRRRHYQKYQRSLQMVSESCKQGHMESQYNVGFFYHKGELVNIDHKKAVHWLMLSAVQGDTEAQIDLGVC